MLGACGGEPPTAPKPVATVTVSPENATLVIGGTVQLTATVLDSDGGTLTGRSVMWVSSDPAVTTVDSLGLATGIGFGEATITATADGENGTAAIAVAPQITTVAGTGVAGFSGDGESAKEAQFDNPYDLAFDGVRNLYITDVSNQRVRRIDISGIIITVAGSGPPGFSGDGGPATQAELFNPCGLALDAAGNLYIADTNNNRIRRVDSSDIIMTVAGTGPPGFSGDGGSATQAQLNHPQHVAVDREGNIYVSDSFNKRVRKIGSSGTITTVAGGGTGQEEGRPATEVELTDPEGLAVDDAGNLYIADDNRVWRVDRAGLITTVAGGGLSLEDRIPATQAALGRLDDIAVNGKGNLYIALPGQNRVRRVDSSGIIETVAGSGEGGFSGDGGPASLGRLNFPEGIAVDTAGNLYIADTLNHRIRKVILAP